MHEREQELFVACLDLAPEERREFLERESRGDRALQQRLERLLAAHGRAEASTLTPLQDLLQAAALAEADAPSPQEGSAPSGPGDAVGPYRLLRLLAEGGMGSVWLAERGDGMVNRPIALKLPRGAWRQARLAARMAREREILAALNHPHIARLYDAGVTPEGQPYLALEYVEGRRIDEYCRVEGLDVRARLALFVQVANAVAHAHAKLVVHRDLKPGNILVTREGQARLLDFGIALLLEDGRALESEVTRTWGRTFTPDYASPEQVAGDPVTIASDVYSLGVTLYELLTDVSPYRPRRDSWGALEDEILNGDPLRPSDVAPPARRRALRGDLDTILLKALKKNPEERYATVNAFAEDVERHLQIRPVLAQPDTAWYRLGKFVGRNRLAVGAAAAVALAVLAGAGVAVWQARVARAEHRRAVETRDFLTSLLRDTSPYGSRRTTTVLDLLREARAAVERRPHASPELRVEVLGIVGSSLLNHQETDAAEAVLTQAVNEALRALGAEHPETLRARVRLVAVSRFRGRTRELRQELHRLLPALRRGSPALAEDLVVALKNKAHLEMDEGRFDEGLAAAEEAMEVAGRTLGPRHQETVAAALMLALASLNRGDVEAALARAESAYRLTLEVYPDEATHARRIEAENLYGRVLAAAGQVARGAAHVEAAIERASEVFGPSSRMVGVFSRQLSRYQVALGQIGRALETSERALAISGEHSDRDSYRHADALLARGEVLLAALRTREAADVLGQAAAILASALGPTHERTVGARCSLALAWAREGRTGKARDEVADLLQGDRTGRVRYALGVVERLDGRPEEALRLQREWLASIPPGGAADWDRMQALVEVGLAQVALGRHEEGAESLSDALRLSRRLQSGPTPERALALAGLGRALLARGRPEDARPPLREAQAFWRAFAPDSPWAAEAALLAGRAERDAGADVARAERASR